MQGRAQGQHFVIEIVTAVVQKTAIARTLAQPHVGAGFGLQHEGKIFAPHAGRHVAHHALLAHQAGGNVGRKFGLGHGVDGGRVDALVHHLGAGAKARCNGFTQSAQPCFHEVLDLGAVGSHRAHQRHLAGDHAHGAWVAALHRADRQHHLVNRRHIARGNALCGGDDVGGHQHRVNAVLWPRAVPAFAGDDDLNPVHRRLHRAGRDADDALSGFGRVVDGVNLVAREALKQAVLHHGAGAGVAFFAGLEDQHRRAVKVAGFGQVTRCAHQHGGVAVVPAGVHQAGLGRFPGELVVLSHGQGVHVGPQPDHARAMHAPMAARRSACNGVGGLGFPPDDRHHPGFANARVNLVHPAQLERLSDALGRVHLFKAEFRMRVQVAPKGSELGMKRLDVGKCATACR